MNLLPDWKIILRRAHSVRFASLASFFSVVQAILMGWQSIDLSTLPIPDSWRVTIYLGLTGAAAIAAALAVVFRVIPQPAMWR